MGKKIKLGRKRLTDNYIRGLRKGAPPKGVKPLAAGDRWYVQSEDHKYVRLVVTGTPEPDGLAYAAFLYGTRRFPGSDNPTDRLIGVYPATGIAAAHAKAREWDTLIDKGVDPRDERVRLVDEAKKAKAAKENMAFSVVAEKYLKFAGGQRQIKDVRGIVERELLPAFDNRPIDSITPTEGKALIISIAQRGKPYMAKNTLAACKAIFGWALDERSPFAALKPKRLIGTLKPRQRLLTDDEVCALWVAAKKMQHPYGSLIRFIMLTGVRLHEASDARWDEITGNKWLVPPERFKSETYHLVPLSDAAMQLLADMPRNGPFLLSYDGVAPINSFSKNKEKIDALSGVSDWRVHDLRRVVRTGMARLRVDPSIAELVIGHGKKGLERVYELEEHEPEMREALELWAERLTQIVGPASAGKRRRA
jgi:integrase